MTDETLSERDMLRLDELLARYGNERSVMGYSELNGFLAAIVSGPEPVPPSHWLPWIWGDMDDQPEWESTAEAEEFHGMVFTAMNEHARALRTSPGEFQPVFDVVEADDGEDEPKLLLAPWCMGYMRGVGLCDWPVLPQDIHQWLALIEQQGEPDEIKRQLMAESDAQDELASELTLAALMLQRFWMEQELPATAQMRTGLKVGRNDPCPCGSGKKFKQCCLH